MKEGGTDSDTSEEGRALSFSMEAERKQSAGEKRGVRGNKRSATEGACGGTNSVGDGRAWEEEGEMVVEPPVKKQMTGGCGMVDAEDGMGVPIPEEEVLASAKNKRKRTSSPTEGVCAKKAKRGRGSKSVDSGGQKANRGRGSKSAGSGGPAHKRNLRRRTNPSGITVAYTPNMPSSG